MRSPRGGNARRDRARPGRRSAGERRVRLGPGRGVGYSMPTRRQFMRSGAAAAASVLLTPSAATAKRSRRRTDLIRHARFPQGVLSGDPHPTGATVLTLLGDVDGGQGRVRLEVAEDPHFRHVVAQRDIATNADMNWSVKAHVTGLRPHTRYWYRFDARVAQRGRPAADRAAGGLAGGGALRGVLVRRTSRTASTTPTTRWPARTSTSSCASATTSTTRSPTPWPPAQPCATTRPACTTRTSRPIVRRGADARGLQPGQVRVASQ